MQAGVIRTLIVCNLGVCLEGFDFIAYSAFAGILAHQFFPTTHRLLDTLLVFAGFGVAYLVRPVGGLFWGIYADRRGRKPALATIAVLMGIGTLLIAVTPPYTAIGIVAPALVVAGRIVQGFAASGEFASATAMLVELAPNGRRSLFAGTQMAAQVLTVALAVGTVMLLPALLNAVAIEKWGWRCFFGLGALIAPLGYYMRARMAESPQFIAAHRGTADKNFPLAIALRSHRIALLTIAGVVAISAAALYLIFVFMPVYAVAALGLQQHDVQLVTIVSAIVEIPVILLAAHLADRYGPISLMLPAAVLWALVGWPLIGWAISSASIGNYLVAQLVCVLLLGVLTGPMPAFMSALLPMEVRSRGIGIVFNSVGAIFGGLGPFLITTLIETTGNPAAPAWWAGLTGVIGAVTMLLAARHRTVRGACTT
jgi:MHS family proline/betaine transporter-like MFS transporter